MDLNGIWMKPSQNSPRKVPKVPHPGATEQRTKSHGRGGRTPQEVLDHGWLINKNWCHIIIKVDIFSNTMTNTSLGSTTHERQTKPWNSMILTKKHDNLFLVDKLSPSVHTPRPSRFEETSSKWVTMTEVAPVFTLFQHSLSAHVITLTCTLSLSNIHPHYWSISLVPPPPSVALSLNPTTIIHPSWSLYQ